MGWSTLALMGMGAAMSTVGSYFSAKTQKDSLRFQADMLENNAQMELLKGERQQQQIKMRGGRIKAAQKTGFAANGIDLSSDSAVYTMSSTDLMTEVDANTAASNAIASAWGYRTKSMIAESTADAISPGSAAFGSLLTNAGSVAQSWYMLKKLGAFDAPPASGGFNSGGLSYAMADDIYSMTKNPMPSYSSMDALYMKTLRGY